MQSDRSFAKLTKDRIFSMAVLPSASTLVVAAGDVKGRLGLWRPHAERHARDEEEEDDAKGEDAEGEDANGEDDAQGSSLLVLQAHRRCVGGVLFDSTGALYSGGYDNEIRRLDVAHDASGFATLAQAPRAASSAGDGDVTIHGMAFGGDAATACSAATTTIYYGRDDGGVARLDVRAKGGEGGALWQCHEKKVNTVHLRPHAAHYMLTASLDRTVSIWDVRKMGAKRSPPPICTLAHALSVNAAAWSPEGRQLVTTCQDHALRTFSSDSVCAWSGDRGDGPRYTGHVRHNNKTGRWLSKFACQWDPREPSAFVIGSMTQPRCVEAYMARGAGLRSGMRQVMRLETDWVKSVLSVNLWHPCLPLLVGANSSGRVYIYEE